jgi:hypothetical protein
VGEDRAALPALANFVCIATRPSAAPTSEYYGASDAPDEGLLDLPL